MFRKAHPCGKNPPVDWPTRCGLDRRFRLWPVMGTAEPPAWETTMARRTLTASVARQAPLLIARTGSCLDCEARCAVFQNGCVGRRSPDPSRALKACRLAAFPFLLTSTDRCWAGALCGHSAARLSPRGHHPLHSAPCGASTRSPAVDRPTSRS
jgi:hypothetical protein